MRKEKKEKEDEEAQAQEEKEKDEAQKEEVASFCNTARLKTFHTFSEPV